MSPYGDYDTVIKAVTDQLAPGPWLLGERFTAADVLWGTALTWTTGFKLVPLMPVIQAYIDRWNARPSVARVKARDARARRDSHGRGAGLTRESAAARVYFGGRCSASSIFAIWLRCTSSGPSAKRSVRACA